MQKKEDPPLTGPQMCQQVQQTSYCDDESLTGYHAEGMGKAMKADRDHCLEVGASDYISKPLDIDQLHSLLRVWLSGQDENL